MRLRASRLSANAGNIRHLAKENLDAQRAWLERCEVAGRRQQRLVLIDELVADDVHSAQQIVPWLENGLVRIMRIEEFVLFPGEVATVAFLIHVGELQQSLLAHDVGGDVIPYLEHGIPMLTTALRHEAGFRSSQSLEEIIPEDA